MPPLNFELSCGLAFGQQGPGRIREPGRRHEAGGWRIGVAALVEAPHGFAEGGVFRLRGLDAHRCADVHEGEEAGRRFLVQADATVRARMRMNEALVETVAGLELDPEAHRVAD